MTESGSGAVIRRSVVVQSLLAYRMRRHAAAVRGEIGVQVFNIPQLAARLAGGFRRVVSLEALEHAIVDALNQNGFDELSKIRHLPGMTRAIVRTLRRAWDADIDLVGLASRSARIHDLALIESRIADALPIGMMLPRALRDAALSRLAHAEAILGSVELDRVFHVPPCWRPLFRDLATIVQVDWIAADTSDSGWFPGGIKQPSVATLRAPDVLSCANAPIEALEALRWVRALLSSGRALPNEIAIASATTAPWDLHFLAGLAASELPLHFAHGVPALATRDGQRCAALAAVLLDGVTQERVRRLAALIRGQGLALDALPSNWLSVLPADAQLLELQHWRSALDAAMTRGWVEEIDPRPAFLPLLEMLFQGTAVAQKAGDALLRGRSLALWRDALRGGPAEALDLALTDARLEDDRDPANSVVWCPAGQLAAAPRPWVRLIGLTQSWPRHDQEDPLLPADLASGISDVGTRLDRLSFSLVCREARSGLVLSRSRRDENGRLSAPSPLLPDGIAEQALAQVRIPEHTCTPADRLLARLDEFSALPLAQSALACWHNWRIPRFTPHDGVGAASHPVVARALARVQSSTSLQRLFRDPLGFVWRYALGWWSPIQDERPLSLDDGSYGQLVHELLRRAIDRLEPDPGYAAASNEALREAIDAAAADLCRIWPSARSVPPDVIWISTVREAADMAFRGLTGDPRPNVGTQCWTEVPFGQIDGSDDTRALPWDQTKPVIVPGVGMQIRGVIDRVDWRREETRVRLTDYKTGKPPRALERLVIGGGADLQRALYALAASQLLEPRHKIQSRLIYLRGTAKPAELKLVDEVLTQLSRHVSTAGDLMRRGQIPPNPDLLTSPAHDFGLALPANAVGTYIGLKRAAFQRALAPLATIWRAP